MIGIVALVAAVVFGGASAFRLIGNAQSATRNVAIVAALVAAICGAAHWHLTGDTRWLVGSVLMLGALGLSFTANSRIAFILSLILGDLGLILFVIALATGFNPTR